MGYRGLGLRAGAGGGVSGSGTAYGTVPASIGVPANLYQQTSQVFPQFQNTLNSATNNIRSELSGGIDAGELRNLAAQLGIGRGMPMTGDGLDFNNVDLLNQAQSQAYARRRQGVQDFSSLEGLLAGQQTDPNLAANIADRNAAYAAAPDPRMAAEQLWQNWLKQFNAIKGANQVNPAGGSVSVYRPPTFAPPTPGAAGGSAGFDYGAQSTAPTVALSATPGTWEAPYAGYQDWMRKLTSLGNTVGGGPVSPAGGSFDLGPDYLNYLSTLG